MAGLEGWARTVTGQHLAVACLFAILAGGAIATCNKPARAHDPYGHWRQPDAPAVSCCHDEDCRPTRAYMADDGRWRAWDGRQCVVVPPGKVLPTDYAGDGRSHLCERAGRVLCFSPTTPKG